MFKGMYWTCFLCICYLYLVVFDVISMAFRAVLGFLNSDRYLIYLVSIGFIVATVISHPFSTFECLNS